MQRINIKDGVYLNIINDTKLKTNYFSINFIVPLSRATAAKNAMIPAVLKLGCANYPSLSEISKQLDYLYAASLDSQIQKVGDYQVISFTLNYLKDKLLLDNQSIQDDVTQLLKEIIFNPLTKSEGFDNNFAEREKLNLLDLIRSKLNNKNSYAMQKCISAMYKDSPYGLSVCGEEDDVSEINEINLYEQYIKLISSSHIEMFFYGEGDTELLKARYTNLISGICRSYSPLAPCTTDIVKTNTDITECMEVNQGKLVIGCKTPFNVCRDDYASFIVFNEIFGGSPTSKLFMNVREAKSLCYYCRSVINSLKGSLLIASGIEVTNAENTKKEIFNQLDNMKKGIIDQEEIDNAVNSLLNSYESLNDDPSSLCSWYLTRILANSSSTIYSTIESIKNVSKSDIINIAGNIDPDTIYFLKGTLESNQREDEE